MPEIRGLLDKKTVVSFACGVLAGVVFFALLVLILLVFSTVFYFLMPYGHPPAAYTTSSGFARIKPMLASLTLSPDGVFHCVFVQGVGTNISVKEIRVNESYGQASCRKQLGVNVPTGDSFEVQMENCGNRSEGDAYSLSVEIDYNYTLGGVTSNRTEQGVIRGAVE